MKVFLATDHSGLELKNKVKEYLQKSGYDVIDCGANTFDKDDDYPDFIAEAASGVSKDPQNAKGIVFGGSGQGEAMVANKFKNVRCAVFYAPAVPVQAIDATGKTSTNNFEMLRLTREHNDSNMLSLGVRFLQEADALEAIDTWLTAPFSQDERHKRRIEKIKAIE